MHGAIEIDQPLEVLADQDLAIFLANLVGVGRLRIRANRQRPGDRPAELLDHFGAVDIAQQNEAIGQDP